MPGDARDNLAFINHRWECKKSKARQLQLIHSQKLAAHHSSARAVSSRYLGRGQGSGRGNWDIFFNTDNAKKLTNLTFHRSSYYYLSPQERLGMQRAALYAFLFRSEVFDQLSRCVIYCIFP